MSEPISQDHLLAIGRIVVAVSEIDSILTDLTTILMGTDIRSCIIVVHHQQTTSKIDNVKALFDVHYGGKDEFKEVYDTLSSTKGIIDFRNTLAHAYWVAGSDKTTYAVKFKSRGKLARSRVPYSARQIHERADEAHEIVARLVELRDLLVETASTDDPPRA